MSGEWYVMESVLALSMIGLTDATVLYLLLIRRRARVRRDVELQQQAGLRGLVRVFLSHDGSGAG